MAGHLLELQACSALSGQAFFVSPLGLLTIAALLPTPWVKRLVDTNVRALTDSDLAWADVALVSGMLVQKTIYWPSWLGAVLAEYVQSWVDR
jgi:hypothetical protein